MAAMIFAFNSAGSTNKLTPLSAQRGMPLAAFRTVSRIYWEIKRFFRNTSCISSRSRRDMVRYARFSSRSSFGLLPRRIPRG
jgi:hypothetical protein